MYLRIISDIHSENLSLEQLKVCLKHSILLPSLETDKDSILVLAGDIGNLATGNNIDKLTHLLGYVNGMGFERVIYVAGNHEYYGCSEGIITSHSELIDICHNLEVTLLSDGVPLRSKRYFQDTYDYFVGDKYYYIHGGTFWTNFDNENKDLMNKINLSFSDHHHIRIGTDHSDTPDSIRPFLTQDALRMHEQMLRNIDKDSESMLVGTKHIIISHHAPSMRSVHPDYIGDDYNHCFVSNLDEKIEYFGISLWIHGHTHHPVDYMIGNCRVVSNPIGYYQRGDWTKFKEKVIQI